MSTMSLKVARGFKLGTMRSTIEVPAALRIKRTSGIDWLDDAIGGEGGFTPTTTMMLTGGPGAGKSTLMRIMADTLTKAGHIAIYNSGEESLYQCQMACERLDLKLDFMMGEEVMLPKLLTYCDNVRNDPKNAKKQVFLLDDSLQTLDDGKYVDKDGKSRGTTSKTPTYCAEMIVDWAQSKDKHGNFGIAAFVSQCTKSGEFAGQNTIRHAIDTHAHLYVDEKEKSDTFGCLIFEVSKNRWGCNNKSYILQRSKKGYLEEAGSFKKAGAT